MEAWPSPQAFVDMTPRKRAYLRWPNYRSEARPCKLSECRPTFAKSSPARPKLGRLRADLGRTRVEAVEIGRSQAKFAKLRPDLPDSTEFRFGVGPKSAMMWPEFRPDFDRLRPRQAELRSRFGPNRPGCGPTSELAQRRPS